MIQHKENGLLVANQDVENLLKQRIVEDENLYRYCKKMHCKSAIFFGFPHRSNDLMNELSA
jgi:hypothetical protein